MWYSSKLCLNLKTFTKSSDYYDDTCLWLCYNNFCQYQACEDKKSYRTSLATFYSTTEKMQEKKLRNVKIFFIIAMTYGLIKWYYFSQMKIFKHVWSKLKVEFFRSNLSLLVKTKCPSNVNCLLVAGLMFRYFSIIYGTF